jgi:hypothetical protein
VRAALGALRPDVILVEGPPDAAEVLPLLADAGMEPPVALLVYVPDQPRRAAYYPFAVFSPEWQAIRYGLTQGVPVRFMDLPMAHQFALLPDPTEALVAAMQPPSDASPDEQHDTPPDPSPDSSADDQSPTPNPPPPPNPREDPLGVLAAAAGYSDGERWWEHLVEQRRDSADLFAGILEAMGSLREAAPPDEDPREAQREAWMRQTIRAAQAEGFGRIAVICGAWHGPALATMPPAKADAATLKGLPKVATKATWVPWTYGRLSFQSGYGAGIQSPGWYEHLWTVEDAVVERWLTRVARLLRAEDLDASSAHVIEAVRLAEALAALRDRPLPGLPELTEAIQTVMCFGSTLPLRLIHEKLIVGERLGAVPATTPMVPLQQDLQREQKRLRFPAEATEKPHDFDLRQPTDRDRSLLLHRLGLLGIPWGKAERGKKAHGTFHEYWRVQWQPEFAVDLITAGIWGNTVFDAATAAVRDQADRATELPPLTDLVSRVLLADLPEAIAHVMARVQAQAALASDVGHLMEAVVPLAGVLRYGNVRRTDARMVGQVVDGLVARICIGLPGACASLNDEAAAEMLERVLALNDAIALLENAGQTGAWHGVLGLLADQQGLHGLLAGRACRILLDAGVFAAQEAARRMGLALSAANDPAQAAAWVEGFLRGSGLLLLHDVALWAVLDQWVTGLAGETFTGLLPLLRRTFSTFAPAERRLMGEQAARGLVATPAAGAEAGAFDVARAEAVLPLVARLLGLERGNSSVAPPGLDD